ncbi:ribonuclease P [Afipia sp. P52-10]|jgi:ribonuclease P protein component|uniref:ribonuclease P protein component n=1 Tax=Afipia sp. P52-10 TaxID=1429916 RepID=UPI0003DF3FE8|nr:ribonuclease P protein component [Afipia sp. P52-10]ETR78270.1 ribonuclease P [Afipia sp. P52-10]
MDRLRQRADFLAAAAGVRFSAPAFTVQARTRRDPGPVRIGFTVSKKVGTAVERNRVRRRLRDMVRRNGLSFMRPHCDYVLIGRRAALSRGFETMLQDFETALTRLDRQLTKRATATPQAAG